MKKLQHYMTAAILGTAGIVCCANAQDSTSTTTTTTVTTRQNADTDTLPNSDFYRANELSLDAFGMGSIGQQTIDHFSGDRVRHNGRAGAGLGVNYFFTRCIGIGGDAFTENTAHDFVDSASGNLIVRVPIADTGIAPYAFAGGGYQFDEVSQRFAQGGAGIEFRLCRHMGFFVDARYVFAGRTDDYGVGRAGLRMSF
ncbi:MAG TPA: hypothetical protein VK810_06695 [Dongiaceae bacterium]|jgi:hypothetical protein|nr:hypothetical protein [Dongiaceae bacterium]